MALRASKNVSRTACLRAWQRYYYHALGLSSCRSNVGLTSRYHAISAKTRGGCCGSCTEAGKLIVVQRMQDDVSYH